MVNRNLLSQFELTDLDINDQLNEAFLNEESICDLENWLPEEKQAFDANKIVTGRVANILSDRIVIDVGHKSEGEIPINEWQEEGVAKIVLPKIGDEIQVLIDSVEDENGIIQLSFRKAKRLKEWQAIIVKHKEGDVISGSVTKNQGWFIGQHWRECVPARIAGRYSSTP